MDGVSVENFQKAALGSSGDAFLAYDSKTGTIGGGKRGGGNLGYLKVLSGYSKALWAEECSRKTLTVFRECLGKKYGVFGEHAFDMLLSGKLSEGTPLTARDVRNVLGTLDGRRAQAGARQLMLKMRLNNEITRQIETHPMLIDLPKDVRNKVRTKVTSQLLKPGKSLAYGSQSEISAAVSKTIRDVKLGIRAGKVAGNGAGRKAGADDAGVRTSSGKEIVGLRNVRLERNEHVLKTHFLSHEASVEDRLKAGTLASGLRVNSRGEKLVLEKLKMSGVEPGFVARPDWSEKQTRELMTEGSRLDRAAGRYLKEFRAREPKTGPRLTDAQLKRKYFGEIRDRLMAEYMNTSAADKSSIAKLRGRYIVKLDYNEGDRSALGYLRKPARYRDRPCGILMREMSGTSALTVSSDAIREALANDLTRMMGVPAQEAEIVRGKYLNGKPKLMLKMKMAEGYADFKDNYLKDGRIQVPGTGNKPGHSVDLGRYKVPFLLLADRDAIGAMGQNKGLIGGDRFFAIDPGHSLEGNGKYLKVEDDFSFSDHPVLLHEVLNLERFSNYSVFDDSNRSEKLKGWLQIREQRGARKGEVGDAYFETFDAYKKAFAPSSRDSADELELKTKTLAKIDDMQKEFEESYAKLESVFRPQVRLYESVMKKGGEEAASAAIDVLENFERATSPVRKYSRNHEVELEHLEVVPKTRTKWTAQYDVRTQTVVYSPSAPLPKARAEALMRDFLTQPPYNKLCSWRDGGSNRRLKVRVPVANLQSFHAVFSEEKIRKANPETDVTSKQKSR